MVKIWAKNMKNMIIVICTTKVQNMIEGSCSKIPSALAAVNLQEWPLDGGTKDDVGMEDATLPPQSFHDKLLGKKFPKLSILEDLIANKLVKIEFFDNYLSLPKVLVDDKIMEKLCEEWKNTIIVKLLSRDVGYKYLLSKLRVMWKSNGAMDMIDLYGFFQIRFRDTDDMLRAMMVLG